MSDTQNWYKTLLSHCNSLAEKFGLDDVHAEELRSVMFQTAKDQFKAGNKNGIRWMYKKQAEAAQAA